MQDWLGKLPQLREQVRTEYYNKPKVRLLLLQFDPDIADMIETYLLNAEYEFEILVFQATNFIELCIKYQPDILFACIDKLGEEKNPRMSFPEFIRSMRTNSQTKNISLFMFTSTTDYGGWPGYWVECEWRDDDMYFEIPFDLEWLEFWLGKVLIKRSSMAM